MIIHHMVDGSIRKNIEGVIVPSNFENVYALARKNNQNRKKENRNGDCNTTTNFRKK